MSKKKPLPKYLNSEEKQDLWDQIHDPRDRAIVSLGLSGLRVSEIIGLKLSDLDWEQNEIRFTAKGGKERIIPMHLRLRIDLAHAIELRPIELEHEYVIWNKHDPTKGITRFAAYALIRRYGERAGLKKRLHPHMLRHTAATEFYRECRDIYRTQKFLGHSRIDTTTIYAQLDEHDVRETLEKINRPNFIARFFARLRTIPPQWLLHRPSNGRHTFTGGTIGRRRECALLKQYAESRIHCVLVGERGSGKSHLIKMLEGDHIFQLDAFRPPRESLVSLCEQAEDKGLIAELPRGRGTAPFIKALREIGRTHRPALIIDDLTAITPTGITELRKLIETWTIIAGLDVRYQHRATDIFFGSHEVLPLHPLSKSESQELTKIASQDLDLKNKSTFIANVVSESRGNPRAILEMVERGRRTQQADIDHPGMQKTLSATPFLSLFLLWAIVSRYSASSIGRPDLKIIIALFIVALSLPVIVDRILVKGSKL